MKHTLRVKVSLHAARLDPSPRRQTDVAHLGSASASQVISAQQLPYPSDFLKRDSMIDPFVEVTIFIPSLLPPTSSSSATASGLLSPTSSNPPPIPPASVSKPSIKLRTRTIEDNGFNPTWDETLVFDFDGAEGMEDLVFVRFDVRYEGEVVEMLDKSVGSYCVPLGSLNKGECAWVMETATDAYSRSLVFSFLGATGYRHLPLQDQHLNQFLFSSVFVHLDLATTVITPGSQAPRSPRPGGSPRLLAQPAPFV